MPIISDPPIAVQRTPMRSASHDSMMPPQPIPSQTNAPASAGMDRKSSTSAAIRLSATGAIHAAPKAIAITTVAAAATIQDVLVSMEGGDCMKRLDHTLQLK